MDCRIKGAAYSCGDSFISFHSSKESLILGIPAHKGSRRYGGCRRRVHDRMKHYCSRAGRSLCEGMRNWAKTRILFLFYFDLVSVNVFVHLAKLNVH